MSSLRNCVKRIAKKERSQPIGRQRLGILEKKKDYKQRAVDYHRKEDRIKSMKKKASMKNPDEFYFGMHTSKVREGKHSSDDDYRSLSPGLVKIMKDQDLSYVRVQKQKDMKKVERLQASLHLLNSDADGSNSERMHTVFVQSTSDAEGFDVAQHFDTIPEMAHRTFNRLRTKDIELLSKKIGGKEGSESKNNSHKVTVNRLREIKKTERKIAKRIATARSSAYREMEKRKTRADLMKTAEDHLITEKLVAGKGRKRKVEAGNDGRPSRYKWRRKRLG